ncbi:MAG: hypothetical protein ACO3LT_09855 [Ilumatobacteraceae bacterium]
MQLIPVIATVASAGVAAYSSYSAGQAQKKAGAYNAAVSRNNAILIQQQAQQEAALAQNQAQWQQYQQKVLENQAAAKRMEAEGLRTTTEENLKRRREDYRRILSRQRAQFAKSGVAMAGTPIEVLAESAARMELEAQDVVNQTRSAIEAMYYESELIQAGAAAQGADVYLTQWRGRNALTGGKYRAELERSSGRLGLMQSNSAARSSYYQAGGSLLSGASKAAGQLYSFN